MVKNGDYVLGPVLTLTALPTLAIENPLVD
jgi:hypothetical protein